MFIEGRKYELIGDDDAILCNSPKEYFPYGKKISEVTASHRWVLERMYRSWGVPEEISRRIAVHLPYLASEIPAPFKDNPNNNLPKACWEDGRGPLIGYPHIIFDLETTGLDGAVADILEFGAIDLVSRSRLFFRCMPSEGQVVHPDAIEKNGFSPDTWCRTRKTFGDYKNKVTDFMRMREDRSPVYIGHNVGFDKRFLVHSTGPWKKEPFSRTIDTMTLAHMLGGNVYTKSNLEYVINKLAVPAPRAHCAINDVIRTYYLFEYLVTTIPAFSHYKKILLNDVEKSVLLRQVTPDEAYDC